MANTDNINDISGNTMVHPLLRIADDTVPAEPWISKMASIDNLIRNGINKSWMLVFKGEADGVSRYSGHDDLWDHEGDCKVRLGNQEVCFDSNIIFETRSDDLLSLISECVCERGIHYIFRLPPLGEDVEKINRYNLAIRNFIATIIRKPIIGNTLVSALEDLQIVAKHVFKLQHQPEKAAAFVHDLVENMKFDNFINRPADICKFLAWTEKTRWSRGFVETFAHCVGMLNCGHLDQESLEELSPTSRALLEQSCTKMHYSLMTTEIPLTVFAIGPTVMREVEDYAGIQQSLLAFQNFLHRYYAQLYGTWPPPMHQSSAHWLTRSMVQRLQKDFGNLYDLLVDTNIQRGAAKDADADSFGCGLDRGHLFATWDSRNSFDPLTYFEPKAPVYSPTVVVEQEGAKGARRSSLIPAVQKHRNKGPDLHDIYTRATNAETNVSDFCKAFQNHEASIKHRAIDTHEGRLGRWIVVYCMMQVLSRVSVDIQGLRYTQGVEYFLNANINGTPPWSPNKLPETIRAAAPQYGWAALYARSTEKLPQRLNSAQKKDTKAKFEVMHLADGRVMLKDPDGHIVFR
ncbi:hypothetical protein AUEXF2481DRAFT_487066 [Aureobasidium subglaciale EXF-2481]|uniref:DUF8004 domain-containing protein n=1 Tax=Aureobasidium subglaciale (strain EXF-2481) TaxID=1043005 RepID=A0A074YL74_AURSE|nr:uncharacterized protein AUEXF2481DRAFT_487066 [Aureobasidium subglaciale EXF-2481]KEQ98445.1 hypothetical protein AUEXF2481DRAFT_487066 [Aureobasidium subglaciale EXF-2481]